MLDNHGKVGNIQLVKQWNVRRNVIIKMFGNIENLTIIVE